MPKAIYITYIYIYIYVYIVFVVSDQKDSTALSVGLISLLFLYSHVPARSYFSLLPPNPFPSLQLSSFHPYHICYLISDIYLFSFIITFFLQGAWILWENLDYICAFIWTIEQHSWQKCNIDNKRVTIFQPTIGDDNKEEICFNQDEWMMVQKKSRLGQQQYIMAQHCGSFWISVKMHIYLKSQKWPKRSAWEANY